MDEEIRIPLQKGAIEGPFEFRDSTAGCSSFPRRMDDYDATYNQSKTSEYIYPHSPLLYAHCQGRFSDHSERRLGSVFRPSRCLLQRYCASPPLLFSAVYLEGAGLLLQGSGFRPIFKPQSLHLNNRTCGPLPSITRDSSYSISMISSSLPIADDQQSPAAERSSSF